MTQTTLTRFRYQEALGPEASERLALNTISARHCVLELEQCNVHGRYLDYRCFVTNLGGDKPQGNDTQLNEKRLPPLLKTELHPGDILQVSWLKYRVHLPTATMMMPMNMNHHHSRTTRISCEANGDVSINRACATTIVRARDGQSHIYIHIYI